MRRRIIIQAEYEVEEGESPSDIATTLECLNFSVTGDAVFENVCVWLEDDFIHDAIDNASAVGVSMRRWLERIAELGT